jgi:hypothetical protein
MALTMLGREVLKALMSDIGRVDLVNDGPAGSGLRILAAVLVRHDGTGGSSRQVVPGLNLAPGEGEAIDPPGTVDQPLAGLEVLLRLFSGAGGIRDVYLASPADAVPALHWEIGVRADTEAVEEGDVVVPERSGLVAYLRALD